MPKRVLLVSYHFPPDPCVASMRLRALARYLPEHDWDPLILTATRPDARPEHDEGRRVERALHPGETSELIKRRLGLDQGRSFQEQLGVPQGLREGRRSLSKRLFYVAKSALVYPDDMRPWSRHAQARGLELLRSERFDAILSSAPPASVSLVGHALHAASGLPWVADLRDLWTDNHLYPFNRVRRRVERRLERKTLATARTLVTVSEPWAERLRALHRVPVCAIENGFDPRDVLEAPPPLDDVFSITYAGTLYDGQDPRPLLRVVGDLCRRRVLDPARVRLDFWGTIPAYLPGLAAQQGLAAQVRSHGFVPREQVLARQRSAQLLLLLAWQGRSRRGHHTAKVYEYLAARRPILASGPGGDVIQGLLAETGAGTYCAGEDALREALVAAWRDYEARGQVGYQLDAAAVERYTHPRLAQRFAALLDACAP